MIHDLKIIEPLRDHRLVLTSDYGINIVDTKTSMSVAEKVVIRNVISRNTIEVSYTVRKTKGKTEERKMKIIPKHSEIIVTRKSLVYVPKWKIILMSGDFEYKRSALAASCTFMIDEIEYCPMHSSLAKIWNRRKRTAQYVKYVAEHFVLIILLRLIKSYTERSSSKYSKPQCFVAH